MQRERITIFDTTLRDGEQAPGYSMNLEEKLRMARQLDRLGVDIIEAGFPIASDGDFESVSAVAAEVRRPVIAALSRATEEDIRRAHQALQHARRSRLHIFLSTSDIHLTYKLRTTRAEALQQAVEAVCQAVTLFDEVEFSSEDATRTDIGYLTEVLQAVAESGATILNIPDTVGYTVPEEYAKTIAHIRDHVKGEGITISTHCHNDLGMAVANTLAAVSAGARQIECTINGIGERAGNASLEELVMLMHVRGNVLPYQCDIDISQIFPSSQLLSEITGVTVQPNKAIVGRNAFAHEAGIHQDGVIKNPLTYEIMTPQSVGVPENRLVLGKHSGRHALSARYEQLGYSFNRTELDRLYRRFTALADRIKTVEDDDLLQLLHGDAALPLAPSSTGHSSGQKTKAPAASELMA